MSVNPRVLRLNSLDEVKAEMRRIGADRSGIDIMSAKGLFFAVKIEGLRPPAANIIKQEMLSRGGDATISRSACVGTETLTDVLLLGTIGHYRRLCPKLQMQPFKLAAVAAEIERALCQYSDSRGTTRCRDTVFDWGTRTYVMGIVNVTPDSFSGDGLRGDVEAALAQARRMVDEGADIIDVGGESTRPGHTPVSTEDEIERVLPVVERLTKELPVPVSVDTYKADVAERAVRAGASMVNDVWGLLRDPEMARAVALAQVPVVIMHNQEGTKYNDLMADITRSLRHSIEVASAAGIRPENIIIDPGFGFGKTKDDNLQVLAQLEELKVMGRPILMGTSRKSTIGYVLDLPVAKRLEGTAATVALAIANGADIVRVHDVKEMVRVVRMSDAVVRPRWRERSLG